MICPRFSKIPKTDWWLTYPSETNESIGMMTFPTEWENTSHVPNHQSVMVECQQWPLCRQTLLDPRVLLKLGRAEKHHSTNIRSIKPLEVKWKP